MFFLFYGRLSLLKLGYKLGAFHQRRPVKEKGGNQYGWFRGWVGHSPDVRNHKFVVVFFLEHYQNPVHGGAYCKIFCVSDIDVRFDPDVRGRVGGGVSFSKRTTLDKEGVQ